MPEREPFFEPNIYQGSVPEVSGVKPEEENKLSNPGFLQEQFNLPKEQWDEQFRALVQEKSEANQKAIQETEEAIEKGEHETPIEAPKQPSEVLRQKTFERYKNGLGLNEENFKGKRILDLGSGPGEFVQQLTTEGITQEAYGLDAQTNEPEIEDILKGHLLQGDFQKELPAKNLDYVVSVGAVSNYISEGEEGISVIGDTVKSSLASLKDNGEIRIYPIQEAQKNSELAGLIESRKSWDTLVQKVSDEEDAKCTIEPRAVKVIGKNNDVILESVLIIKKLPEKEKQWRAFEGRFKEEADALGYGIELKIIDTVVGLNALGIHSSQSCEGHVDRGRITPWVDANSQEQPKQFVGEDEIYQEVADEYGLSKEEVERALGDRGFEAWQKASERMSKNDYTPEFKQWVDDNRKMAQRVKELVAEFNSQRKPVGKNRIEVSEHGFHTVEIHNGGEDYESVKKERTEQEKRELAERLTQYQTEFKQFAQFLKEKFFEGTDKNPEKTKKELDASPEEKEKKLKYELFEIQLQYAQRLFEKKISSPSESISTESMDFKQVLEEFTDLSTIVRDAYRKRTGKDFGYEENYREFEKINQAIIEEVVNAYNENPNSWMSNVGNFILDAINQLPEGMPSPERGPKEFHAGILRYSVEAGHGGLEEYGITPKDECVKTHLDPLFKQGDMPKGKKLSELYKEAYALIAEDIKKNYPNAKALVSESWLFDTNLAKEIGMHVYPSSNENMFHGRAFWGQFITREGEINKERVKQFLETGKPPFIVKSGYIPINEFMEKYGSQ